LFWQLVLVIEQRRGVTALVDLAALAPAHFPPYQTVHMQLRNWQKTGL
jgi:hypothetical protein